MKKLVLASLILASGQMAVGANWVPTGVSSNVNKETIEIDFESISAYYFNSYDKSSYYVTAWIKMNYPTAQKLKDGRLYRQTKELWYVDCLGKRITRGDVAVYTSNGNLVWSNQNSYVSTYSSSNWDKVIPDTVGDGLSKAICNFYDFKSTYQTK